MDFSQQNKSGILSYTICSVVISFVLAGNVVDFGGVLSTTSIHLELGDILDYTCTINWECT